MVQENTYLSVTNVVMLKEVSDLRAYTAWVPIFFKSSQ